ncbi:hemicentin-1-like isoform X1, partial [Tachysurus ichikawai]
PPVINLEKRNSLDTEHVTDEVTAVVMEPSLQVKQQEQMVFPLDSTRTPGLSMEVITYGILHECIS